MKFQPNLPEPDHPLSRQDKDFRVVANRVIYSLRTRDWKALCQDAADTITIETHMRAYTQFLSADQMSKLFPGYKDGDDYLVTVSGSLVNTHTPLPEKDKKKFARLCESVTKTYDWSTPPVEVGLNLHFGEEDHLFGPAITGKAASNWHWYVQFELIDGNWKIRKLITDLH